MFLSQWFCVLTPPPIWGHIFCVCSMYISAGVCTSVCDTCGGQRLTLGVLLNCSSPCFWDRVSHWTWNSAILLGWLANEFLGSCCVWYTFLPQYSRYTPSLPDFSMDGSDQTSGPHGRHRLSPFPQLLGSYFRNSTRSSSLVIGSFKSSLFIHFSHTSQPS